MIRVEKGTVELNEGELIQIIEAVKKAKESIEFTDKEMPNGDMTTEQWLNERARRGILRIGSPHGGSISFDIRVGQSQHESLGYQLLSQP